MISRKSANQIINIIVSVVEFCLLQSLIRVAQTRQQVRKQSTERGNRHGARQEQPPMGVRVRWDEEKLLLRGQWNGTTTKKEIDTGARTE